MSPNGTVYVGTVDGGVWSTSDLTEQMVLDQSSTTPGYLPANFYKPLTDQEPSLAVSAMALDPTDSSGNTLWVGTGSLSSADKSTIPPGVRLAGPSAGLLMTTNGGLSWTSFGNTVFNQPILSIVPRGQTILVGTKGQGLWESTDGGADFTQVSFFLSPSLTNAIVSSIVVVPGNSQRYYAALTVTPLDFYGNAKKGSNTILNWNPVPGSIQPSFGDPVSGPGIPPGTLITAVSSTTITLSNAALATNSGAEFGGPSSTTSGIYESADGGSQRFEIDDAIPQIIGSPSLIITANVDDGNTNLFAVTSQVTTIPNPDGGNLVTGVWRVAVPSNPLGNYNWVDTPGPSIANYVDYGHFDAITDPTNPNVIYVCGWEQCLFRVDTTPGNSSWKLLSLNSYGEPHDDIRSLTFLNSTTLIATSDGGIYGLPGLSAPGTIPGTILTFHWVDLNVDIQDTEFFQVAYDSIDGVIVGGAQDNGTSIQDAGDPGFWSTLSKPAVSNVFGNFGTNSVGGGDGGEVAVDNTGSTATIFLTADGTLKWYDTNGGSGNTGVLPSQLLTQADQNTYNSQAENDASYLFSSNQSVIGGILLGMSSLYMYDPNNVSFLNPLGLSLVSTPFIAGNVTALIGFNTGGTAYFGTSKGQLFMSTGGLGTFGALSSFALIQSPGAWYPGGVPNGTHAIQVVGDPNDPRTIYVLDSNGQVWGNAKVGYDPWINITGDLGTFTNNANLGNTVTSLQLYDPTPYTGNSVLLVGALGGVFQTGVNLNGVSTNPNQSWRLYGEGLPNVQVSSLEYVASDDLLLAGTYGRGAWEVADASQYFGAPIESTITTSGGTILLQQDPTQPGYAEILTDGPGASVSQVIQANNLQLDEPWTDLGQITFDVASETVDILNVPQGVNVTVDGGHGTNTVNVGSAANQMDTIVGTVTVGISAIDSLTSVNLNDQGDDVSGHWTISGGIITDPDAFPGTITSSNAAGVVINAAGVGFNSFTVNDTSGTSVLTLNTGGLYFDSVTVNDTSSGTALNIVNQGADATTDVMATGPESNTYIADSASDNITLGNSDGVQDIQGDVSISTKSPDSDTLVVDDQGDTVVHTGQNAVTVTGTFITGLAPATINYQPQTLSSLTLDANGLGTLWKVQDTPIPYSYFAQLGGPKGSTGDYLSVTSPTTTTLNCSAQDTVNVGDPSIGLQEIFGTLNIYNPKNLNVDDHETTYIAPIAVSLTPTSITGMSVVGLGQVVINYGINSDGTVIPGDLGELTVQAGTGGTTFLVGDMTAGPATVNLSALGTGNSLDGPNTNVTWKFQEHNNSPRDSFTQGRRDTSTVDFAGIDTIAGGSGDNDFQFIQAGFNGSIDGGSSGDSTLDFSKYGALSVETTQDGTLNGVQGNATEGTSFNDIDTVLGDPFVLCDIGNTTAENESYQGDFTHTLTVSGFLQMQFNFAGNFSGELLASTEGDPGLSGTPNFPFSTINVTGTIEAGAMIKVGFLLYLFVDGDMDGTVKGFGVNPTVSTIQSVFVDGTVGSGAHIVASSVGEVDVQQDVAGFISETTPTGDFQSITIGGSLLPTGLIDAPSGGTLSVGGDLSG